MFFPPLFFIFYFSVLAYMWFLFLSEAPHYFVNITWIKGKCPVQEVSKKMRHYKTKFLAL